MRDSKEFLRKAAAGALTADEVADNTPNKPYVVLGPGGTGPMGVYITVLVPQKSSVEVGGADKLAIGFESSDSATFAAGTVVTDLKTEAMTLTTGVKLTYRVITPRAYLRYNLDVTDGGADGVNYGNVEIAVSTGDHAGNDDPF